MSKQQIEIKLRKLFNGKSNGSLARQLEKIALWLSNPKLILGKNSEFYTNLLQEYCLKTTHTHQNLVLPLLAIIAAENKDIPKFHKLMLRIIIVGESNHQYMCASLSTIASFVNKDELCVSIFKQMSVQRDRCETLSRFKNIITRAVTQLNTIIVSIKDEEFPQHSYTQLCEFYRDARLKLEFAHCSREVAFQLIVRDENCLGLDEMVLAWYRLFLWLVDNEREPHELLGNCLLILLTAIFNKTNGFRKVLQKISFDDLEAYIGKVEGEFRLTYLLNIFKIYLSNLKRKIDVPKARFIFSKVWHVYFLTKNDGGVKKNSLEILDHFLRRNENDEEFDSRVFLIVRDFVTRRSFDEFTLQKRMTDLILYLADNNYRKSLNTFVNALLECDQLKLLTHAISRLTYVDPRIESKAREKIGSKDIPKKKIRDIETFIYLYFYSTSLNGDVNDEKFGQFVAFLEYGLKSSKAANRSVVFGFLTNVLKRYSDVENFTPYQEKLHNAFIVFVERVKNERSGKEVLLLVKLLADLEKQVIEHFNLSDEDIILVIEAIRTYLYATTNDRNIPKVCSYIDEILSVKENVICHDAVKSDFIKDMLENIEAEVTLKLYPLVCVLLKNSETLGFNEADYTKIRDALIKMSSVLDAKDIPQFFEQYIIGVHKNECFLEKNAFAKMAASMLKANTDESIQALCILLRMVKDDEQFDELYSEIGRMPEEYKKGLNFLLKVMLPALEAEFKTSKRFSFSGSK